MQTLLISIKVNIVCLRLKIQNEIGGTTNEYSEGLSRTNIPKNLTKDLERLRVLRPVWMPLVFK